MDFVLTSEELIALLVLSTASSFTPGPNTTLSTALAANLGFRRSLRFVLAVPVGWGLLPLLVGTRAMRLPSPLYWRLWVVPLPDCATPNLQQ